MTSEGLSRVEVALDNDDEDPGELSRLAGLHLGLADVKDAVHRLTISKLYSSFFALREVQGQEVGAPLVGRVCSCSSSLPMGQTWSLFFCQKAIEEAMWATPGLEKAESPSEEVNVAEPSHRASKRFFSITWIPGNVTCECEEIVHSNTATALGIHLVCATCW